MNTSNHQSLDNRVCGTGSVKLEPASITNPCEILYFSRGRGRGHAIPDMAIGEELKRLNGKVSITYASYSSGAHAFRSCGYSVLDLQMPDDPDPWDALFKQLRLINHLKPQLVIAHEESQAIFAADVYGIPSIFITDFFLDPTSHWMRPLIFATEVIFIGESGRFTEPPFLRGKVHYVGPAIRKLSSSHEDRSAARERMLGTEHRQDAVIVLCQPGNHSEADAAIADILVEAWEALRIESKHLIWVTGKDYELLQSRLGKRVDISVIAEDWELSKMFAACDLVITKGNRITTFEAASIGIPSITLSNGRNWPDDVAISSLPSNVTSDLQSLTATGLVSLMKQQLFKGRTADDGLPDWRGIKGAAERIALAVSAIR